MDSLLLAVGTLSKQHFSEFHMLYLFIKESYLKGLKTMQRHPRNEVFGAIILFWYSIIT